MYIKVTVDIKRNSHSYDDPEVERRDMTIELPSGATLPNIGGSIQAIVESATHDYFANGKDKAQPATA